MFQSKHINNHWSLVAVVLLTPVLLLATIPILPTFDDWTSLTSPSFEPFFSKERFLFFGYHWRPFDSIFGYIIGRDPNTLFPLLNHVCVVLGHAVGTLLLYLLARELGLSHTASNVATLFFFLSPGMLATVLAVDGLNQTYANLWALVSTLSFLKLSGRKKYILWLLFLAIATLCKENALMYAIIAPTLSFAFHKTDWKTFRRCLFIGLSAIALYAAAVLFLPSDITIHPEYVPGIGKSVKDIFKFLLTTWVAVDFVSLLHQPSRNLLIAGITLLLSLPLLYYLFVKNRKQFLSKRMTGLVVCLFVAVAPHIFTVFSMMHTYAGLGMAALIIGTVIDSNQARQEYRRIPKMAVAALSLYFLSALFVDAHLWHASYQSGLVGKEMAQEAIAKTKGTPNNVYVITIEDDYPRLSSFCVIPSDAFGWGNAAQYANHYEWPTQLNDTIIERNSQSEKAALEIARRAISEKGAECVWIVNGRNIDVVAP